MKGLIIKPKWADLILSGDKTIEIRGSRTKIRGEIGIIKSGSKKVFGTVELMDCVELDEKLFDDSTKQSKSNDNSNNNDKKEDIDKIEIIGGVLVVGKITYRESYENAFRKIGYKATIIDGYESYSRVNSHAKNFDTIVIAERFSSHNNMDELKRDYSDKNLVFCKKNGANYMARKVEETLSQIVASTG